VGTPIAPQQVKPSTYCDSMYSECQQTLQAPAKARQHASYMHEYTQLVNYSQGKSLYAGYTVAASASASRVQVASPDGRRQATEEELAQCTQLINSLYRPSSQSADMPQSQPSRPLSATAAAPDAPRQPQAQLASSNSSQPAAPLLLGPPS